MIRSIGPIFGKNVSENRFLPILGYIFFGGLIGFISILVVPAHFIKDPDLRKINLLITPLILGTIMAMRGKRLKEREAKVIRMDSFLYGFIFAFTIALVRFQYGNIP